MARAFRPWRSQMMDASVHEAALAGIGTARGAFQGNLGEAVDAEVLSQTAAATLAIQKARNELFDELTTQHAHEPDQWSKLFNDRKAGITAGVFSGVRAPQARQSTQMKLDMMFADLEESLRLAKKKQDGVNAATNYTTGDKSLMETSENYKGEFADFKFALKLRDGLNFYRQHHNAGGLPSHRDVGTPAALEYQQRKFAAKEIGDYAYQMALAYDNEEIIDRVNEWCPEIFPNQDKQPIFDEEAKANLKERYTKSVNAAKAQATQARAQRAEAFDDDITMKLLRGQLTWPDEKGNTINGREVILANEDISPDVKRTLTNLYDKQANKMIQGGETPIDQRWNAYATIEDAKWLLDEGQITPEEYKKRVYPHLPFVDESDAEAAARYSVTGPRTRLETYTKDAEVELNKVIQPLARLTDDEKRKLTGGAIDELKRRTRQGFEEDKDVTRKEFEQILVEVIEWAREQAQPKKAEAKEKGPGILARAARAISGYEGQGMPEAETYGPLVSGRTTVKAREKKPEYARVRNDADYDALPSGTVFIGPDGKRRRKP